MSYLVTAPDEMGAAAQGLAEIRSSLAESAASVAEPTTAVAAAAQDQVSALVAKMFSNFGQEFQALSAQADAFHEQFVGSINASAGAYLGTEVANAGAGLLGAVDAPVPGVLGPSAGGAIAGTRAAAADLSLSSFLGGGVSLSLDGGVLTLPPSLGGVQVTLPSIFTSGLLGLLGG